ncbi:MAG: hypothetical protein GTO67_14865 [Gammaproteobacteria bacterium]|nr:hypothetical protein [Gammaproteobacteria bacterium]NIM73430.1 hypothetical protein [Gammaproteobacteria bacterium]NIN39836.1 hypothetical protein [Gammaproteobacteria bacterium]NIO25239.1 hypothetical protein [Gammaproteobacteria bacterium]NIO65866.1 hypothetical protein [Gammaproteobacteria bacterium]
MLRWRSLAGIVAVLALALPATAGESPDAGGNGRCSAASEVTPLASQAASAGYVSNVLNRDGSIRSVSHDMLSRALESARSKQPIAWVVFTSMPEIAALSNEDRMCADLERATRINPLKFEDRRFESADELTNWIMDFTQGKGADGRSLYEQCPGNCSPRYTWWIEPRQSNLKVDAWVVCGQPRDRSSNRYQLTTSLASDC